MISPVAPVALVWQAISPGQAALERAQTFFAARKLQECMDAVDEALKQDPRLVPALLLRARLAMAVRRYDVARESLERALAVNPRSATTQFFYGFQFYEQNEMPAAIKAFQTARKLNPSDSRAALYLGLAKESLGALPEALSMYQEAIRLERAESRLQPSTLLTCMRLQMVLGDFDAAENTVQQALRISPSSRDVQFEEARLHLKRGRAAAAVTAGEEALKMRGEEILDSQVHFLLIQAYQAAGKPEEAARHAETMRNLEQQ